MRKIKVLFIHNTVPEYRIGFWKELSKKVELQLLITKNDLEKKIYGLEKNTEGLHIEYWNTSWKNRVSDYTVVILPPIESIREYKIANAIAKKCKENEILCIYWNERWNWEGEENTLKKSISKFGHKVLIRSICKKCEKIIVSGTKAKEYIENLGISKKISIAFDSSMSPEPKQKIDFKSEFGILENDKVILYFGRLVKLKGLYKLLEAYKMINSDYWLVIGGDGEDTDRCYEYVKKNNLRKVIFLGKVQPDIRSEYFRRADVFILPSISIDAWGLTVNEALEQGTPVIVTDACGVAYDLSDEKNCLKVESGNNKELANAILKVLIQDKNEVECKKIYQKYSVYNMANSFYTAFID